MKIQITLTPVFWILFTPKQLNLLSKWASLHYDSVCKQSGELGGFIYGWINVTSQLAYLLTQGDALPACRATWRDCDITLKICEMIQYGIPEDEQVICKEITASIRAAMSASQNLTSTTLELP